MERVAAEHGDEGVGDQVDDEDNFAEGEPGFRFAVLFDGEDVDDAAVEERFG